MPKPISSTFECDIIGSGTYKDPYRPAIADVKDALGAVGFNYSADIPTDEKGMPINKTCIVKTVGDPELVKNDPTVLKL